MFKTFVKTVLTSTILRVNFYALLKLKHDYYKNDNIRLLMTFKYGFKKFQIHMSQRKQIFILSSNKGHGQGLISQVLNS